MADDPIEVDDFAEVYQRAMAGDEDARSDLWHEFRRYMHQVIRYKAADLSLPWAVEPDDIYDWFFATLFARSPAVRFQNRLHFACYVEKSVRRSTKRTLRAGSHHDEIGLDACAEEIASQGSVVNDLIWDEDLAAAYAVYAALSNRETTICALRQEGCTWREIGQRLDLDPDAARMIYRRAVGRVREECLAAGTP